MLELLADKLGPGVDATGATELLWTQHQPWFFWIVLAILGLLATGAVWWFHRYTEQPRPTAPASSSAPAAPAPADRWPG